MLIGHTAIIQQLKTLADRQKLPHGLLFFGSDGVGKRTAALHFAEYLERGVFEAPKLLQEALVVSPDEKGTIGIDAVRSITQFLSERPQFSKYRTVVIDTADAMTAEAQNAFLKTAEEPPASGLLILIVREPELVQSTLLSRFQKLYFGTLQSAEIQAWLQQEHRCDPKRAKELAAASGGKPGLALSRMDDEKLQKRLEHAREFWKTPASARRNFIQNLIEPDDFVLEKFLDALILTLADTIRTQPELVGRWHTLLRIRENVAYFPLNPRLQLEALMIESRIMKYESR